MGRTIVVGDTHGCFYELMKLLEQIKYNDRNDRLILVGDLLDKGPAQLELLQWSKFMGLEVVLGNHEDWYVRFHKHAVKEKADPDYKNPMRSERNKGKIEIYESLPTELVEWMSEWPLYLQFGQNWFLSHAGLLPGKPIEAQDSNSLMRMRFVDPVKKKFVALNPDLSQPAGTVWWTDLYDQPINLVYGHTGWKKQGAVVTPRKEGVGTTIGLDTGCVYGWYLTAAIFEGVGNDIKADQDPTFADLKALKAYSLGYGE